MKHLCEYQVRQLVLAPGVKPDMENAMVKEKVDQIRAMFQDTLDNLSE